MLDEYGLLAIHQSKIKTCCCHADEAVSGGDHGGADGSMADAAAGGRA